MTETFERRSNILDDPQSEAGASLAEYALLVFLIAVVVAVTLPLVGAAISNMFQQLAAAF